MSYRRNFEESDLPCLNSTTAGEDEILKLLLDHGANFDEKRNDGRTPIHQAADRGRDDTVKILLSAGADPCIADNDGRTARDLDRTKDG